MILSRKDYRNYVKEDRCAMQIPNDIKHNLRHFLCPYKPLKFLELLRWYEFIFNTKEGKILWKPIVYLSRLRFENYSRRVGYDIPANTIGPGLKLSHLGGVIVNGDARIGKNFSVRPYTVIGNKVEGERNSAPMIGDNVNVGCNVSVIGSIIIGDNVVIGAGSVVVKDVPSNCVVGGNPAKVLKVLE